MALQWGLKATVVMEAVSHKQYHLVDLIDNLVRRTKWTEHCGAQRAFDRFASFHITKRLDHKWTL
jgi:hypothetical protein